MPLRQGVGPGDTGHGRRETRHRGDRVPRQEGYAHLPRMGGHRKRGVVPREMERLPIRNHVLHRQAQRGSV